MIKIDRVVKIRTREDIIQESEQRDHVSNGLVFNVLVMIEVEDEKVGEKLAGVV